MNNFLFRKIPVYKICLGFVGLWFLWLMLSPLSGNRFKTQAKIAATRIQMNELALSLDEYGQSHGSLPTVGNAGIVSTFLWASATNAFPIRFSAEHTNLHGETIDYWDTPLQFQIIGTTNFVIRSAGLDKKFGDEDDVVFNSVSNDFVRP